jgi:hypothetical protein
MGPTRRPPATTSAPPDVEPDYLLSTLRRQFESATGFARLCRHVSPELEGASDELVAQETALFEAATASVLRYTTADRPKPTGTTSGRNRANAGPESWRRESTYPKVH